MLNAYEELMQQAAELMSLSLGGSRRPIIDTHWPEGRWRACPICRHAISMDWDEAIEEQSRRMGDVADFDLVN